MNTIVFYISSLSKGGAERVVITLSKYLSKEYSIKIITDTQGSSEYEVPNNVERKNLGYSIKGNILQKILLKVN